MKPSLPARSLRCAVALAVLVAAGPALALDRMLLEQRVERLESGLAAGRLGVGVQDLASGETWFQHADSRFPMQSVTKLPIAISVLRLVDAGRLRLRDPVRVRRRDLGPPHSPLAAAFEGRSRNFSLRTLIEMAVGRSDNTASDVLLRIVGGPDAVSEGLADLGLWGIRVDRTERALQTEIAGLQSFRTEYAEPGALQYAIEGLSDSRRRRALKAYLADSRDTATPRGMTRLLARLVEGPLLSEASTAFLLGTMTETPTDANRLKAGLPQGSMIAHKTGTARPVLGVAPATNDVAIVTLPDGGRFVLVAFLSAAEGNKAKREGVLAEVARIAVEAVR